MSWAKLIEVAAALVIGVVGGILAYKLSHPEEHREAPHGARRRPNRKKYPVEVCVICWDKGCVIELVPCGHVCLCCTCAQEYGKTGSTCPVCRQRIDTAELVFGTI